MIFLLQRSCIAECGHLLMNRNEVKKRKQVTTRSVAKKKRKVPNTPPGYRTCCCGNEDCKQAMLSYFRDVHRYDDPAYFFPWLYIEVPKMPKKNTKSRSKSRQIQRDNKVFRHRLFLKHLGILQPEKHSFVAFPVHFPLSMYDCMCL